MWCFLITYQGHYVLLLIICVFTAYHLSWMDQHEHFGRNLKKLRLYHYSTIRDSASQCPLPISNILIYLTSGSISVSSMHPFPSCNLMWLSALVLDRVCKQSRELGTQCDTRQYHSERFSIFIQIPKAYIHMLEYVHMTIYLNVKHTVCSTGDYEHSTLLH